MFLPFWVYLSVIYSSTYLVLLCSETKAPEGSRHSVSDICPL